MSSKKQSDKYLFNVDDYKVIQCIKRGGFGIINLVENRTTGEKYASKTNLIEIEKQSKLFISREVHILIQVQHQTIIQFRGFSYCDFDHKKNITILMDYMKEGSLAELIEQEMKSLCPDSYDNTKRQIILVGIARGMMILHSRHVIHRDLKPENILLDKSFHPRITDFGLSKFFDPHHSMNQSMMNSGTAAYMAPEVINSDRFNTKADVYAFGIIMYEIITGKRAYNELFKGKKKLNEFQLKVKVTQGFRPAIDDKSMKKSFKNMIEKCWSNDPKERPTFKELFKKLSLSREDDFYEFEDCNSEAIIIDDDDDDDDENDDENFINKKYSFDGVDYEEFLNYVDEIKEEPKTFKEEEKTTKNQEEEIDKLKQEIKSLKETSKSDALEFKKEIKRLNKTIKEQSTKILALETELNKSHGKIDTNIQNPNHFFYCDISLTEPGILCHLKSQEKTPFDRLFIASQSSNDIYELIDLNTDNKISTTSHGNFKICFKLEEPILLNGIKIFSCLKDFPKSFDIEIDGKVIISIKEAKELNGKSKEMTINFSPIKGQKIRFIQTGPNWDKDSNFLFIKKIELLSNEPKYSKGVFTTLIELNEKHDPHRCPVKISASCFDFNKFHLIESRLNTWTFSYNNSWFQIELTKGLAILKGFRLKKLDLFELKNFKIICTDDVTKPMESWINLIEINENERNRHQMLNIYEFTQPSPLTRFIRLVITGPNWEDDFSLAFIHLDFFGWYF